jgi:hypothetical protein
MSGAAIGFDWLDFGWGDTSGGNDRHEGWSRRDRSNSVRILRSTALNRIAYPVLPREH